MNLPRRKLPVLIALATVFTSAVLLWNLSIEPEKYAGPVRIQLAYPLQSLNPTVSKDWQTVLINNHIYPRLIPRGHESGTPYITERIEFLCTNPPSDSLTDACKEVRISFKPRTFQDCQGRDFSVEDLRTEFETIINKTPWLLPNARRCDAGAGKICMVGVYRTDVQRRMHSVSFRFGWSKAKDEDARYGAGPYCLTQRTKTGEGLTEGLLEPKDRSPGLPQIRFTVSQNAENDFHFALYGSTKLLKAKRLNIQAHTPIGYYVVTNPTRHKSETVPWNLEESKGRINDVFLREKVFFSAGANINDIFPEGTAVTTTGESLSNRPLEFVLPDYLPACQELASALTEMWKKHGKAKAVCKDVVSFVYDHVWTPKRDWDGFIVGVTQHDPGRNTVEYEYFSPDSPESWVYDHPRPKEYYYLAGVGQSIVTVDGERFCGLRPNLFGLGDIFISDLLGCDRGWLGYNR